ncbi:hypothetical protein SBBP2_70019 [Burkholderiales bacterium]|nr:hypothetical protein SBBP2_70019 [Burkholderiales bacterium]
MRPDLAPHQQRGLGTLDPEQPALGRHLRRRDERPVGNPHDRGGPCSSTRKQHTPLGLRGIHPHRVGGFGDHLARVADAAHRLGLRGSELWRVLPARGPAAFRDAGERGALVVQRLAHALSRADHGQFPGNCRRDIRRLENAQNNRARRQPRAPNRWKVIDITYGGPNLVGFGDTARLNMERIAADSIAITCKRFNSTQDACHSRPLPGTRDRQNRRDQCSSIGIWPIRR